MFKTIGFFISFTANLIGTLPNLKTARRLLEAGDDGGAFDLGTAVTRQFSQKMLNKTGGTFIVSGQENIPAGTCVFIANHQSDFDIPLIAAYAGKPLGFVAKKEMKKVPIVRDWMEMIKCTFIDRDSARKSMEAILKAIETVKSGHSMVIYPEGTRNKGYLELEFKAGSFKLATKSHAPIVPAVVEGSYKLFEANHRKIKPATVYLSFLAPIETAGLSKAAQDELPERVEGLIRAEVARLRSL